MLPIMSSEAREPSVARGRQLYREIRLGWGNVSQTRARDAETPQSRTVAYCSLVVSESRAMRELPWAPLASSRRVQTGRPLWTSVGGALESL
jgi:hypothetical protein